MIDWNRQAGGSIGSIASIGSILSMCLVLATACDDDTPKADMDASTGM